MCKVKEFIKLLCLSSAEVAGYYTKNHNTNSSLEYIL